VNDQNAKAAAISFEIATAVGTRDLASHCYLNVQWLQGCHSWIGGAFNRESNLRLSTLNGSANAPQVSTWGISIGGTFIGT
jgi:hypothetical protein